MPITTSSVRIYILYKAHPSNQSRGPQKSSSHETHCMRTHTYTSHKFIRNTHTRAYITDTNGQSVIDIFDYGTLTFWHYPALEVKDFSGVFWGSRFETRDRLTCLGGDSFVFFFFNESCKTTKISYYTYIYTYYCNINYKASNCENAYD